MRAKEVGLALSLTAAVTVSSGCSGESSPPPETSAPASSTAANQDVVPWPELQACSTPGTYTPLTDPNPEIRCAAASGLKDHIDQGGQVQVIKGAVAVRDGLSTLCITQPLLFEVEVNDDPQPDIYLGVARVGQGDIGVEVFTFPFETPQQIPEKQMEVTTLTAVPEGVYTMDYNGQAFGVGLLAAMQVCEKN